MLTIRVLRNLKLRSGSISCLGMGAESWPLSNKVPPLGLANFPGMLWGRAGAWPVARGDRSVPAPVFQAWRLMGRVPATPAQAPPIHIDARRWLSLSLDWAVSLRLHRSAAAPGLADLVRPATPRETGSSHPGILRIWHEQRFLLHSTSTSMSLPGRSGERAHRRHGEPRVTRLQGASGLAWLAPGDTRVAALSKVNAGRDLLRGTARARFARRALALLKADTMTLVRGSSIGAPLQTLALLAEEGRVTSHAASLGRTPRSPFRRITSDVQRGGRRLGSSQDRVGGGLGLRRPPTFTQRNGSVWDGNAAHKQAGEEGGALVYSQGFSRSPASSRSDFTVSPPAKAAKPDGVSPSSVPLQLTAVSRSTPTAIYRLAAPVLLPRDAIQAAGCDPSGSVPDALDTTVGRLVEANLDRWEQRHLAPRRLAELTSRHLEQQLRRERERLGV